MRNLWLLTLLVLVLFGCAGKSVPVQPIDPVDGKCSPVKDMCLMGTPSDTGDTLSPYGWVCLGLRGGADASCSTPTAPLESGESFSGQDTLIEKVKASGALRGTYTIFDPSFETDDPSHASAVSLKCAA